ncbi:hypothetical protein [Candidatus Phytoplasma oryzae]|nr:hypothetical protein PIE28_02020 [Candidatus Phytoplasma oryzae]
MLKIKNIKFFQIKKNTTFLFFLLIIFIFLINIPNNIKAMNNIKDMENDSNKPNNSEQNFFPCEYKTSERERNRVKKYYQKNKKKILQRTKEKKQRSQIFFILDTSGLRPIEEDKEISEKIETEEEYRNRKTLNLFS